MDLQLTVQDLIQEHGFSNVLKEIQTQAACFQTDLRDNESLAADDDRSFDTMQSAIAIVAHTAAVQVDELIS